MCERVDVCMSHGLVGVGLGVCVRASCSVGLFLCEGDVRAYFCYVVDLKWQVF